MMKLFAYRDRSGDADKEFGRYHALDLYSVIAMMTEPEWEESLRFRDANAGTQMPLEAGKIVSQHFATPTSPGILRMRESKYFRPALQVDDFIAAIRKLFP